MSAGLEGFKRYRGNGWYYGGKLTRKNFEEVVDLIKRCNGGEVHADRVKGEIKFSKFAQVQPEAAVYTANIGDYLIRNVSGGFGQVDVYSPAHFKQKFTELIDWAQLSFYNLTDIEYGVIEALKYDSDLCYNYDWIVDFTHVDRKQTREAVTHLRELNIVTFHRGLMNDDGQVAGSGFGINEPMQILMAELLQRRYEDNKIPVFEKYGHETIQLKNFGAADGEYAVINFNDNKLTLKPL